MAKFPMFQVEIPRVGVVKTTLVNTGWFLPPNKSQKWEILGNMILII
jgi:hypothetical protein